jgi:diguanylate cyclase (GGDEF)-like protein
MAVQADKDDVFRDYAAFLKALLPQAQGFVCHDGHGKVFWSEAPPEGTPPVTDEYRALLVARLRGEALPEDGARLKLGGLLGYLLRLEGEGGRLLGVLAVLIDRSAGALPYAFVADVLKPALRSLQREMSLRIRVVEAQRKLQVQAAEERLLHALEKLLGEPTGCAAALQRIADLCCEHLGVGGAWLFLPDKQIAVAAGERLSAREIALQGETLLAEARADRGDPDAVVVRKDQLWLTAPGRGPDAQGVLVLRGLDRSEFSERRLRRVARYVGSHVESLLDRHFDGLTGLAAWPAFERTVAAAATGAGWCQHLVMMIDVDQLHVINEAFGREAGDDVLRRLARLLRERFPEAAVSRIAGDNFAVLMRDVTVEAARHVGEELCSAVREYAYVRGDQTHRASASIGIGPLEQGADARASLSAAQVACQAARDRGGGRVEVYESADASIVRRLDDIQLVGYVRNAIENGRLALMAQQLLPLKAGRVPNYYEVLVRIVDDAGQYVAPGAFMSAAERYKLMEELDRWVVATTLAKVAGHGRHLRGSDARFAINLSGQSLGSEAFLGFVDEAIRGSGVPADLIAFEITESVAVARMQQAQAFMHELRKLGCHFSLDDFGTGLSSFAYLKLFPVDTLKIDGSFVRDIATNMVSQSVVAAIAEVARVMQLETVAEYVQEQAALDLLRSLNISYAQGFFVGTTALLETQIDNIDQAVASGTRLAVPSAV